MLRTLLKDVKEFFFQEEQPYEVQTRDEAGGLRFFPTLEEALDVAKNDASIWKVSFSLPSGESVRMTRDTSQDKIRWVYDPIDLTYRSK